MHLLLEKVNHYSRVKTEAYAEIIYLQALLINNLHSEHKCKEWINQYSIKTSRENLASSSEDYVKSRAFYKC